MKRARFMLQAVAIASLLASVAATAQTSYPQNRCD